MEILRPKALNPERADLDSARETKVTDSR